MGSPEQQVTNARELSIIALLVEEYCTTPETTASEAVEAVILELKQAQATVSLLKHKLDAYTKHSL
tara:strand:+ start:627 stop:824 length:198 start_codon:yes stop_codon:yes gene_type:complete